jgi:hypothetical protein
MADYSGIVMNLRLLAADLETAYGEERGSSLYSKAADAIEELLRKMDAKDSAIEFGLKRIEKLQAENEQLKDQVPTWIMIESRPMDEEEREYYSERYDFPLNEDEAVIYCCPLPEHGQEVLVLNRYGRIWLDTFDDDPDYGVGFETNGDMDGIAAWMPLPEPPKEENAHD